MEEIRAKLIELIERKGTLNKETILVSQKLDKFIVSYYKSNSLIHNN